jgi:hypothetical protein
VTGHCAWLETIDKERGLEVVIRINGLMKIINAREAVGNTEGKIKHRDVCKRLIYYGRQVGDRDASVTRLRCAYALPTEFLDGGSEALQKNGIHKCTGKSAKGDTQGP